MCQMFVLMTGKMAKVKFDVNISKPHCYFFMFIFLIIRQLIVLD